MVGQKHAQPAVASIVMSMESVFAVLAGCILLHETMTAREIAGCVLMFAAVILANVPNRAAT
jgi:drug/metabolite transporter (DMT)-like permease